MARRGLELYAWFVFLLIGQLEQLLQQRGAIVVEARMEAQFEKCCGLGTSWAMEGLRCEKFVGPVSGVPRVEQGLCLEAVDICCVRAYHDQQCEKGKADARNGLACVTSSSAKTLPRRGDYHRDCCEGCKLGILAGSMAQGCSFKTFTFGIPWDPAFLQCCHEALPNTTLATDSTDSTEPTFTSDSTTETKSESSPTTSISAFPSSDSSSYSSFSPSSSFSTDSTTFPTPKMDDICQLMKGLLCSDICIPTPGSYYCGCREGFTLLEDEKTCSQDLPTDRCKSTNPCEQRCTDTGVAVICSCNPGFELADDKRSCIPSSSTSETTESDEDNELLPLCPAGYRYNSTLQVCNDVDECAEKKVRCPGRCENTIGSFRCVQDASKSAAYETCPPGYRWDPRNRVCADIDECAMSPNVCIEGAHFCVNTQGSFTCLEMNKKSCPAGFKFDKMSQTCKDVDECAEGIHSCLNETEECRNIAGAYECDVKCDKGFVYSIHFGTCVDVNECIESTMPCPEPGTECINTIGGYDCKKFNNLTNNNPLAVVPLNKTVKIECYAGYRPSKNIMEDCVDIDECAEQRHICEPDERCINVIGSYRCELLIYSDTNMNQEEREQQTVETGTMLHMGDYKTTIQTTMPTFVNEMKNTSCMSGYTFDAKSRRCVDVDECASEMAVCGIGERCVNSMGTYECYPACPPGFKLHGDVESNGREDCRDIDECSLGLHTCNTFQQVCRNTNGSYVCQTLTSTSTTTIRTSTPPRTTLRTTTDARSNWIQINDRQWSSEPCAFGYKRDPDTGRCTDIDECVEGPGCRDHERCRNTLGHYECFPLCSAGWFFSTTTKNCQDVDECLLGRHDCPQTTHRCVNTNGSYHCELILPCQRGFNRAFNGSCVDIDECVENLHDCRLQLHQYCVNREGTYECLTRLPSCTSGYQYSLQSRRCEDVNECLNGEHTCDARRSERCINLSGTYRCERPPVPSQSMHQRPACPSGFRYHPRFKKCTDIDECAEALDTCGDEICYNQPGGYSCAKVPVPITRRPTTTPMAPSADQKCLDGTKFVRNRGCVDIDECREIEDACSSNENCVNTMGSYTCNCRTGFRRDNLTQACVDINECQLQENDCLPTQRCDNTIGSYICTRFLPCGTGYTLNAATEICEDDDECILGTHDCGGGYHCRNTLGSYRCDRNPRVTTPQARPLVATKTTMTTPTTTPFSVAPNVPRVTCPRGFQLASGGKCMDIDECQRTPNPCARSRQRCINTIGSYKCTSTIVLCGKGYALDPTTGQHCVDIDECAENVHECSPGQTCENRQGAYVCKCPPGHTDGPNKDCADIDECSIYGNGICGSNSRCENTVGSYRCSCDAGFENVGGVAGGMCQDVDECRRTPGLCQHYCTNVWGSYRCNCELGFRLNADNRSCADINECEEFKDNNLCIGICENTPGSYSCKCPDGYTLGADGRTCQDIDECVTGSACNDPDELCQNTRGGFRCNRINCPSGYVKDRNRKNRCLRPLGYCQNHDLACYRMPSHYSYNYVTFVSMFPLPPSGQLELFTLRGTHLPESTVQFSMAFVEARAPPGVTRATESCFALRRPTPSQAVLAMTRSIQGPQEIELDLSMEIYHSTVFAGSAVAKLLIYVSQYEF